MRRLHGVKSGGPVWCHHNIHFRKRSKKYPNGVQMRISNGYSLIFPTNIKCLLCATYFFLYVFWEIKRQGPHKDRQWIRRQSDKIKLRRKNASDNDVGLGATCAEIVKKSFLNKKAEVWVGEGDTMWRSEEERLRRRNSKTKALGWDQPHSV